MAGIAHEGHKLTQATKSVSYTAQVWNSCKYWDEESGCSGGYDYPTRSSSIRINGTLKGDSTKVYIGSKKVSVNGGGTTESDSWSQPSDYYSGVNLHSSSSGTISSGNSKGVYISGKLIAVKGSTVNTHEGVNTTIAEGSSKVFIGG